MLVAIGKGIELDVDVTRFNSEVHDISCEQASVIC